MGTAIVWIILWKYVFSGIVVTTVHHQRERYAHAPGRMVPCLLRQSS